MKIQLRLTKDLYKGILADLARPHPYAAERVAFVFLKSGESANGNRVVLATEYMHVDDEHYIQDASVGASINGSAIRQVMQQILDTQQGALHVHMHNHGGVPRLSSVDRVALPKMAQDLRNIGAQFLNGFLLLSQDRAVSTIWSEEGTPVEVENISVAGLPLFFLKKRIGGVRP